MTSLEYKKNMGAFYTPSEVAEFLTGWAIRSKNDLVLDPGSGEGVFMKSASTRFAKIGVGKKSIQHQIYGIEYDRLSYDQLANEFTGFNVIHSSFFDVSPATKPDGRTTLPFVDAVIGNPPYVERERLQSIGSIRKKIIESKYVELPLHLVTDIYGYFLIHATSFLKDGGRLAFIISDSWLNMDFGMALKQFLLRYYQIKAIVAFEERVFFNALVRSVLVLAEKSSSIQENYVQFIRLKNINDIQKLNHILSTKNQNSTSVMSIKQSALNPREPWGVYLKASKLYFDIISKPIIVPLREIANIGIGIQSLKNDFYIVSGQKARELGLEKKFLSEVIMSPRDSPLVIKDKKEIDNFVIYCDKLHEEIRNTKLLGYIKRAEKAKVSQRGKTKKIIGYQNVPRINQARRSPWYNMIPEIEKRCRGTIILPRRSFTRFFVVWNKARVVVNDNFINVEPKNSTHIFPLLTILNSSFFEYLCRVRSQTYGGGVYDLRPDDVKNMPIINLNVVSKEKLQKLSTAYSKFVESNGTDRSEIDDVMKEVLNLRKEGWMQLRREHDSLRLLASISNGKGKK